MKQKLFLIVGIVFFSFITRAQTVDDSNLGQEDKQVFQVVEQIPEFMGGNDAMMKFISKYLVYPESARENNKQGKVVVKFIVNEDGSISDITTINNPAIGFGLEEAAMNVVRKMPKWKPGRQNGKPVKVYFTLPISFKLN